MAGTTITVLDSTGSTKTAQLITAPGTQADADSSPVALSTEGKAQLGALTETAPATDTASSGLNGRLQRIAQRITSFIALLPSAIGRTTSAGSLSVVSASDDALMGIVTETAPASDTASSGLNGRLQRVAQNLTTLNTSVNATNAQLPTALGTTTDSASLAVAFSTEGKAQLGSLTETAPASDTASSGISGRLQRIAQRITSLIGIFPPTPSGSVQVTITRPANVTPYTAGDVLGGALTFATGLTSGQRAMIAGVDLMPQIAAIPAGMTSFRLHLYNVTPPSALADNAVWDLPSGDRASYLGYVDVGTPADVGSTLFCQSDNVNKAIQTSGSANVFGYLVTNGGFTPNANSEVYLNRMQLLGL